MVYAGLEKASTRTSTACIAARSRPSPTKQQSFFSYPSRTINTTHSTYSTLPCELPHSIRPHPSSHHHSHTFTHLPLTTLLPPHPPHLHLHPHPTPAAGARSPFPRHSRPNLLRVGYIVTPGCSQDVQSIATIELITATRCDTSSAIIMGGIHFVSMSCRRGHIRLQQEVCGVPGAWRLREMAWREWA